MKNIDKLKLHLQKDLDKDINKIKLRLQEELEEKIKYILEKECPHYYNLKSFDNENEDDKRCYEVNGKKESCIRCWELEVE